MKEKHNENKERYCLYLNPIVVDESIENIRTIGGKFSPFVESLLKKFNLQWKKKN